MAISPPNKPEPPTDPRTIQPGGEGSQALYLRMLTEQLVGWDNPRAMLERALVPGSITTGRNSRRAQSA